MNNYFDIFSLWMTALDKRLYSEQLTLQPQIRSKVKISSPITLSTDRILKSIPGLVFVVDSTNLSIQYCADSLVNELGVSCSEFTEKGMPLLLSFMHTEDVESFVLSHIRQIEHIPSSGEIIEVQFRLKTKEGEYRWFLCRRVVYEINPNNCKKSYLYLLVNVMNIKVTEEKDSILNVRLSEQQLLLSKSEEIRQTLEKNLAQKQNQLYQLKAEQLEAEALFKSKELVTSALSVAEKNELLLDYIKELQKISQSTAASAKKQLYSLIRRVRQAYNSEHAWDSFNEQFYTLHQDFMKELTHRFPDLTLMEVKVCTLLKLNLSTKEIARILQISDRTIDNHRYRLRKKLLLNSDENLSVFLTSL